MPLNIAVLGSGNGTSFRQLMALHKGLQDPLFNVKLLIANKPDAGILAYGNQQGLNTKCLSSKGVTREVYDKKIDTLLRSEAVELLVLVGYMRILSRAFTKAWAKQIINVHPSLLPKHKGLMDLAVHTAVVNNHEEVSGCTVHYVTDEVDGGPILSQLTCVVEKHDTPHSLKQKVQVLEGPALLDAIKRIAHSDE